MARFAIKEICDGDFAAGRGRIKVGIYVNPGFLGHPVNLLGKLFNYQYL
jgi:hypothetical protein